MRRLVRDSAVAVTLLGTLLVSPPSQAQYTADFQVNFISGATSNWSGDYIVGSNTFADMLFVQTSGKLANKNGYLGYEVSANNNLAAVIGSGSAWSNTGNLYVGNSGANNFLWIADGGAVADSSGEVGNNRSSSNNHVQVTGPGSVWNSGGDLNIGYSGASNSLVIENGGRVNSGDGALGIHPSSSNNNVAVRGIGSIWNNRSTLSVGAVGGGNSLVISDGGEVTSVSGYVGYDASANVASGGSGNVASGPTSGNNSVLVTGVGSVWSNSWEVVLGSGGYDSVTISNGGQVFSRSVYVGWNDSGRPNGVLVTGTGSVWNISAFLEVGIGNAVVISGGGSVVSRNGFMGSCYDCISNSVLVTDPGSVWTVGDSLYIGRSGPRNNLVISNGAQVVDANAFVGFDNAGRNDGVRVASNGVWRNGVLQVGRAGLSNVLVVAGGSVFATDVVVGLDTATCDSTIELDSGSVIVTNPAHNAVLEVRHGTFILNGGLLQVDTLVITNPCAQLIHNGGTLLAGSVVLDPNSFRITAVAQEGNNLRVTYLMGPGQTNALQVMAGDGMGGYNTSGFSDIFVVTNNPTAGTVTNFLDIGGATNSPARYYRVRLVP